MSGRPSRRIALLCVASVAATLVLAGCGMPAPDPAIRAMVANYAYGGVTVTFAPDAEITIGGMSEKTLADKQAHVRKAFEKGFAHRLGKVMKGSQLVDFQVQVTGLTCMQLFQINLVGGLSAMSTSVSGSDRQSGTALLSQRTIGAHDVQGGFGVGNFKDAKALESGGELNCPLLLALQTASTLVQDFENGRVQYKAGPPNQ